MVTGQCLCASISYTLSSDLLWLYNCHCRECRAFSGASHATNATILYADLILHDPHKHLSRYKAPGGNGSRCFCSQCGSPILSFVGDQPEIAALHVGSINNPPDKALEANMHTAEKCPWVDIDPGLENFDRAP